MHNERTARLRLDAGRQKKANRLFPLIHVHTAAILVSIQVINCRKYMQLTHTTISSIPREKHNTAFLESVSAGQSGFGQRTSNIQVGQLCILITVLVHTPVCAATLYSLN